MKQFAVTLSLLCMFVLVSCNTIEGVGKDVESAGSTIKESAQKSK